MSHNPLPSEAQIVRYWTYTDDTTPSDVLAQLHGPDGATLVWDALTSTAFTAEYNALLEHLDTYLTKHNTPRYLFNAEEYTAEHAPYLTEQAQERLADKLTARAVKIDLPAYR